jgi:hypothetical protein
MTWYRSQPFGESQALDPRPCVGILADVLGIDLRQAADAKMTASEQGFPTSEVHGLAPRKTCTPASLDRSAL